MTDRALIMQTAADCQQLARALAPFQNRGTITMPGSWAARAWRKLTRPFRRPGPRELTPHQVQLIVSALISAGNILAHEFAPCLVEGNST